MRAPFPWFGGKSTVSDLVWSAFGDVRNYVEPFFGSGAVLLNRPDFEGSETVNDLDGYLANFWRAVQHDPEAVAKWADWPVNECVPAGTMIATPVGPIPVQMIRPGMTVYGERDGRRVETCVIATKESDTDQLYSVGPLRLTGNHPVWTQEHGYIRADRLKFGLHVGVLNWVVDKIDLVMLQSEHGRSTLGNLLAERSTHVGSAVCRDDVQRQGSVPGAHVAGSVRREDASRLLDSIADCCRSETSLCNAGSGQRRRMAGSGAVLDCVASCDADEPHRRRGGCPGLCANDGIALQVVCDAGRYTVRSRTEIGHAWAKAHARGYRENPAVQRRTCDAGLDEGQGFCHSQGEAAVTSALCEVISGEERPTSDTGASKENRGFNYRTQACPVHRDRNSLFVHHRSGADDGGKRSVDQSGDPKGLPLQRQSLSASVAVYNFQTDTGNYFADGILVHNCDLHARHAWLVAQKDGFASKLEGDPDFFDAKIAGWWVWGICSWIGSGWCSGNGPWYVEDGKLVDSRKLPHLGDAGVGVKRKLPHLGDAGRGVNRQLPHLGSAGMGVNRQLPHLRDAGRGDRYEAILATFQELSERLRHVRVCCGDWSRIMGESVTVKHAGITGVFLDPPYADTAGRTDGLYACDSMSVAHDVREWCLANGDNPRLRIALCGYEGEHELPESWACIPWKSQGGYGNQGETTGRDNAVRERIWLSPACLSLCASVHPGLFDDAV